jgi:hypothetical protein
MEIVGLLYFHQQQKHLGYFCGVQPLKSPEVDTCMHLCITNVYLGRKLLLPRVPKLRSKKHSRPDANNMDLHN